MLWNHTIRIALLVLLAFAPSGNACDETGAFGIKFGDKPSFWAKKLAVESGNASSWYAVEPPNPDPRYDQYKVRTDTANGRIFGVVGIKRIVVSPENLPQMTPEALRALQEEGRRNAKAFAALTETFMREKFGFEFKPRPYYSESYSAVRGHVGTQFNGHGPWTVEVDCSDLIRERELAQRVMPELFKP